MASQCRAQKAGGDLLLHPIHLVISVLQNLRACLYIHLGEVVILPTTTSSKTCPVFKIIFHGGVMCFNRVNEGLVETDCTFEKLNLSSFIKFLFCSSCCTFASYPCCFPHQTSNTLFVRQLWSCSLRFWHR